MPSANTLLVDALNLAECGQQQIGHLQGLRCVVFTCPSQDTGIPFANTDPTAPFLLGVEQCVASLSPLLAMGLLISIFIGQNKQRI